MPVVDKVEQARKAPELAVLSAISHGHGSVETAVNVALAAITAARGLDRDRFLLYSGLILAALSEAARKALAMHPQGVQLFDEALQQSFERGHLAGRAADVLEVLDARGIPVSSEQRDRVLACTDLDQLTRWHRRAVTVASADELLTD